MDIIQHVSYAGQRPEQLRTLLFGAVHERQQLIVTLSGFLSPTSDLLKVLMAVSMSARAVSSRLVVRGPEAVIEALRRVGWHASDVSVVEPGVCPNVVLPPAPLAALRRNRAAAPRSYPSLLARR